MQKNPAGNDLYLVYAHIWQVCTNYRLEFGALFLKFKNNDKEYHNETKTSRKPI